MLMQKSLFKYNKKEKAYVPYRSILPYHRPYVDILRSAPHHPL